jgi:DeoR/GlpR family transcriptional regulator of sugar metabolism
VLAESRRAAIVDLLRSSGSVTVGQLEERFGISSMTARRDLAELERLGIARRTHGGAVAPELTSHEDSFVSRLERQSAEKTALAGAAAAMVVAGESVFLDSSSTAYHVARALVERAEPITIITNSQPIMDLVASQATEEVDLIGIGGSLRRLTRSFVGPFAVRTVQGHFADRLFLSVKGLTETGMMTDADALEAEVKRTMIAQASEATLLIDSSKVLVRGLSVVASVAELAGVLAHGLTAAEAAPLRAAGAVLRVIDEPVAVSRGA